MATSDQQRSYCCFLKWTNLQESDLAKLVEALSPHDDHQRQFVQRNIEHFEEYVKERRRLAQEDVAGFSAPAWNTALENSMMWLAGCQPFIFVRLVYVLCGAEVEASLNEFLEGGRTGDLGELSASQLTGINALQEKIADEPIVMIARRTNRAAEPAGEADAALDKCERDMRAIMEGADRLRLDTLRETVRALTPAQAVDFLAVTRKLHLCIHEWGKRRDHKHGRDSSALS